MGDALSKFFTTQLEMNVVSDVDWLMSFHFESFTGFHISDILFLPSKA